MARDRDVHDAIRQALEDTGLFEAVFQWGLKDASDSGSDAVRACSILPWDDHEQDLYDDTAGLMVLRKRVRLAIWSRDEDKQRRDEDAGRLLEAARNALNGNALNRYLGAVVYPFETRITAVTWKEPAPPQREIEAIFQFATDADGWNAFDTSE